MSDYNSIVLEAETHSGERLRATFLPDHGMNLISFKKDELEIIDQSTWPLFEERFAGLGALIGPHFHRRHVNTIPTLPDETLFPHIARVKAKGNVDPFSHGVGRYAPWKAEMKENKIIGVLSGKDLWNGVPLEMIEGQNFKMKFEAQLNDSGLHLDLSVVSDTDSVVGIHYYYSLPQGKGKVLSKVRPEFLSTLGSRKLPIDSQNDLAFDLSEEADDTFFPFPNPLEGKIILVTDTYSLQTTYRSPSQENSWQLYHPKNGSFVCIEPLSAKDPRHPNLSVSSIHISLQIL